MCIQHIDMATSGLFLYPNNVTRHCGGTAALKHPDKQHTALNKSSMRRKARKTT